MTKEIIDAVLAKITALDNSNMYDITLTPINAEQIKLEMSNEEYLRLRHKAGCHKIKKTLHINEPINLKL